ncbi:hypothetical protein PFISCL1PPCAC_22022, partial [Pristionchus fissidentatus]
EWEEEEEEDEVDLDESLMMAKEKEEKEREEEEREQSTRREWYHHPQQHHLAGAAAYHAPSGYATGADADAACGAAAGPRYASPSPPLDEDDDREKNLWVLPACTSPDSMALHLRDPYETRDGGLYQSSDPYSFSSSFSLSPPSDDENSNMGAPWHENDLSSAYLARPPSRLDCSPPYVSLYDDLYSSSASSCSMPPILAVEASVELQMHHHHYDMPTQLLDASAYDCSSSASASSIRVVAAGDVDAAFLALGGERPLQEMRSYCDSGESVLFDLSGSSPSLCAPSSPSVASKKRRSDELVTVAHDEQHKRIKL